MPLGLASYLSHGIHYKAGFTPLEEVFDGEEG